MSALQPHLPTTYVAGITIQADTSAHDRQRLEPSPRGQPPGERFVSKIDTTQVGPDTHR